MIDREFSVRNLVRDSVRAAMAVGATGALVGSGVAFAQASPAAATGATAQNLSQITVTGSLIPRTAVATSQPVLTISRQQIENTGFTSVGELLQNLSSAGASLNVNINNGAGQPNGATTVNIHTLGSKRTLVLVNGQRWPTNLSGQVDLSTIPTAIVSQVQILLDGASAIYGSDAISGVVNIITIKNFNGAEASAYYGMYDAHADGGGWDGKTQRYDFTLGTSSDSASVLLSAGYRNSNPVWAGQRTISKEPYIGTGQLLGSSGTPGGRFYLAGLQPGQFSNVGGCHSNVTNPYCDIAGPINGPNANPHPFTNADRYNYAPANYYVTPQESWHIFSQGHYDLTSNVTFNFTTMYQRRTTQQLLAPSPLFLGTGPSNGLNTGISAKNPYNPFGVDLVPYYTSSATGYSAWCATYGSGGNGQCAPNSVTLSGLGRRAVEFGYRISTQVQDTFYFNGGFTGYYQMLGNQWQWNADYGFSQVLQPTISTGSLNGGRIQTALSGSCPSTPGCVPLDLFGGAGTITPAMVNYITYTSHAVNEETMRNYTVGTGGDFFNSWYAGPWGAAVGYQYLEFDGYHQPDSIAQLGAGGGTPTPATQGRKNTNAEYVELNVPLASDLPLAKLISVDLANRWSQFKWSGVGSNSSGVLGNVNGRAHASTGRVGFKWQPIQQLLIRGTWSEGFRVPSLSELFQPPFPGSINLTDPCVLNPNLPNCPAGGAVQPNSQIATIIGGNPRLQPERSISRQVGFVWSPTFAPGLNVNADYYKVELTNAVGQVNPQSILDGCYQANVAGDCALITRTGKVITRVIDSTQNTGSFQVNGWDVGLDYRFPTTPIGNFSVAAHANFLKMYKVCNLVSSSGGLTSACRNYAGGEFPGPGSNAQLTGIPKQHYNVSVDWSYGNWGATWNMYLIGRTYENCNAAAVLGVIPLNQFCSDPKHMTNEIGTTVYNDVRASYTVSAWNTTFSLGVRNILDRKPPIAWTSFANSSFSYYRVPGRFFYGSVNVNF